MPHLFAEQLPPGCVPSPLAPGVTYIVALILCISSHPNFIIGVRGGMQCR
jgi:hypothetical protein